MKTLKALQVLAKIGKILSTITFIFCVVGGALCLVGILGLALIPEGFSIGSVSIKGIVEKHADITVATCYATMAAAVVCCAGEAVLAKFAERYFRNELKAGTPFTIDGAKELMRLGILAIAIPILTMIVASVIFTVIKFVAQESVQEIKFGDSLSIGLGIAMIIGSLLCRHGAEVSQGNPPVQDETL